MFFCLLDWQNRIEQTAVSFSAVLGTYCCWHGRDQMLLFQPCYIFFDSVSAESYCLTDRSEAWMALKGFPVLAVHQVSVHRNLSGRESKAKDFIRQRKIVFNGISFGILLIAQLITFPFPIACLPILGTFLLIQ